jgi:hypothetical protein
MKDWQNGSHGKNAFIASVWSLIQTPETPKNKNKMRSNEWRNTRERMTQMYE